jgi:hypothetical protein
MTTTVSSPCSELLKLDTNVPNTNTSPDAHSITSPNSTDAATTASPIEGKLKTTPRTTMFAKSADSAANAKDSVVNFPQHSLANLVALTHALPKSTKKDASKNQKTDNSYAQITLWFLLGFGTLGLLVLGICKVLKPSNYASWHAGLQAFLILVFETCSIPCTILPVLRTITLLHRLSPRSRWNTIIILCVVFVGVLLLVVPLIITIAMEQAADGPALSIISTMGSGCVWAMNSLAVALTLFLSVELLLNRNLLHDAESAQASDTSEAMCRTPKINQDENS